MDNSALARLLDGEFEPDDAKAIARAVGDDPSIYESFHIDGMLQVAVADDEAFVEAVETRIDASKDPQFVDAVEARIAVPRAGRLIPPVLPWLIAAVACFALLLQPRPEQSVPTVAPVGEGGLVALLVNEVDAEFADGRAGSAVRVYPGRYQLQAGGIHLRFTNGVDIVALAPAEFEIVDAMSVILHHGSLRALVPEAGHGFTIDAPGVAFEDIGTEFGVSVDRESSDAELHVFAGEVKMRLGSAQTAQLLSTGETVHVVGGRAASAIAPNPGVYPTPADLNFRRWQKFSAALADSPGLVSYLPLANSGSTAGDEKVHARWVSGRWPHKSALLFDRPGDRVELTLPGSYQTVTLSLWMKVDRVDYAHTSLLSSDGADPGDVHWKIDRTGTIYLAVRGEEKWHWGRGARVALGRWTNIVAVVDLENKQLRQYKDGKLVSEGPFDVPVLAPGDCRIGNWVPENGHPEVTRARGFRGRIGEFGMWERVLSKAEIDALWEGGRPSFHQLD
jgi:hypothetical protein